MVAVASAVLGSRFAQQGCRRKEVKRPEPELSAVSPAMCLTINDQRIHEKLQGELL
jgi:hypothetical protein